jgi:uncharacterized protein
MTDRRQIRFDNHLGEKLAATLEIPSHPADKGMVLGHCFTCTRHTRILDDLSRAMVNAGYLALRFDFSGNGQSEGSFAESTYSKQIQELNCAIDYVRNAGASDIILAGHSMGGEVALLTAAQINGIMGVIAFSASAEPLHPDHLLTDSQKFDLNDKGQVKFSSRGRELIITKQFFHDAEEHDLTNAMSEIHCPVLLVYGGQDMIIPTDSSLILHDANPAHAEIFMVQSADHMFTSDKDRRMVVDHVQQWVQNL